VPAFAHFIGVGRMAMPVGGIGLGFVPGRIVMFLREVNLRVSLDATQHGKGENPKLQISIACGLRAFRYAS
jgi:hypothetical protein